MDYVSPHRAPNYRQSDSREMCTEKHVHFYVVTPLLLLLGCLVDIRSYMQQLLLWLQIQALLCLSAALQEPRSKKFFLEILLEQQLFLE